MKREQIKEILTDISKEKLDEMMSLYGSETEKAKETTQTTIDELNNQLKTAKETLKTFEGVDISELQTKIKTLNDDLEKKDTDYNNKLADINFNSQLESTISSLGAKNEKAVKALLDIDTLKLSKNQAEDIKNALLGVKTDNDYLFTSDEPIKNSVKDTGNTNIADETSSLRVAMGLPAETK